MIDKLRDLWPVRRGASFVRAFWATFLRDNKVIPPVLAVAALFVFAWIVVGSFIGSPEDEPVSNQGEIAQSDEATPPAPEIENPNADSYAAYQSKDPFRQLFESAEATSQQNGEPKETMSPADDTSDDSGSSSGSDDASDDTSDDDTSDNGRDSGDRPQRNDPTEAGDSGDSGNSGSPAEDQYRNTTPRGDDDSRRDDSSGRTPRADEDRSRDGRDSRDGQGGGLFDSGGDLESPNEDENRGNQARGGSLR